MQKGYSQLIVVFWHQEKKQNYGGYDQEVVPFYWLGTNPRMHLYNLSINVERMFSAVIPRVNGSNKQMTLVYFKYFKWNGIGFSSL